MMNKSGNALSAAAADGDADADASTAAQHHSSSGRQEGQPEGRVESLAESLFQRLESTMQSMKEDMVTMKNEMATKEDMVTMKNEMATKEDMVTMKNEMATKEDMVTMNTKLDRIADALPVAHDYPNVSLAASQEDIENACRDGGTATWTYGVYHEELVLVSVLHNLRRVEKQGEFLVLDLNAEVANDLERKGLTVQEIGVHKELYAEQVCKFFSKPTLRFCSTETQSQQAARRNPPRARFSSRAPSIRGLCQYRWIFSQRKSPWKRPGLLLFVEMLQFHPRLLRGRQQRHCHVCRQNGNESTVRRGFQGHRCFANQFSR